MLALLAWIWALHTACLAMFSLLYMLPGFQHDILWLGGWLDQQHWWWLLRGHAQWDHRSFGLHRGAFSFDAFCCLLLVACCCSRCQVCVRFVSDLWQGMGFDCIWITPVVDSNGFMGYDAVNIFEIEPHFGSKEIFLFQKGCFNWQRKASYKDRLKTSCVWRVSHIKCHTSSVTHQVSHKCHTRYGTASFPPQFSSLVGLQEDLKRLSQKLHERSMCLILDIVLNHVRLGWPRLNFASSNSYVLSMSHSCHIHVTFMREVQGIPPSIEGTWFWALGGRQAQMAQLGGRWLSMEKWICPLLFLSTTKLGQKLQYL